MPELPDVELYVSKLRERILGDPLVGVRLVVPFFLRSVDPPLESLRGQRVVGVERLGKRVAVGFETGAFAVVHLMVAGRFLWKPPGAPPVGRTTLALFDFPSGTLVVTEASKKRRASLHVVADRAGLAAHQPGGIEPLDCSLGQFAQALRQVNRTLKRALTDPRTFSGIGNAYSDEVLWGARLSPLRLTSSLNDDEVERLWRATVSQLTHWRDKLAREFEGRFPGPGDVTAFRPDFAVHGKFGQPCPTCGKKVQRIVYAENETNYCAVCQNEGRVLADRALSRLLKDDWPRTVGDD